MAPDSQSSSSDHVQSPGSWLLTKLCEFVQSGWVPQDICSAYTFMASHAHFLICHVRIMINITGLLQVKNERLHKFLHCM